MTDFARQLSSFFSAGVAVSNFPREDKAMGRVTDEQVAFCDTKARQESLS